MGVTGIGSAGTLFYVFKLPSSTGARSGFEKAAAETDVVSAAVFCCLCGLERNLTTYFHLRKIHMCVCTLNWLIKP